LLKRLSPKQTVGARETTGVWPRMGATAWSEDYKPDCLKRMSNAHSFVTNLLVRTFPATSTFNWAALRDNAGC
jgi:hypothetical protein